MISILPFAYFVFDQTYHNIKPSKPFSRLIFSAFPFCFPYLSCLVGLCTSYTAEISRFHSTGSQSIQRNIFSFNPIHFTKSCNSHHLTHTHTPSPRKKNHQKYTHVFLIKSIPGISLEFVVYFFLKKKGRARGEGRRISKSLHLCQTLGHNGPQ